MASAHDKDGKAAKGSVINLCISVFRLWMKNERLRKDLNSQ